MELVGILSDYRKTTQHSRKTMSGDIRITEDEAVRIALVAEITAVISGALSGQGTLSGTLSAPGTIVGTLSI